MFFYILLSMYNVCMHVRAHKLMQRWNEAVLNTAIVEVV